MKSASTATIGRALPSLKRPTDTLAGKIIIGVGVPLIIYSVFLVIEGQSPFSVYAAMVQCFVGNPYNVGEVFVKLTPVLMAAMAALIPGLVGLNNCGGEGQLIMGALMANAVGITVCAGMPGYLGIPVMLLTACLAGALWGALPLLGKMVFGMNETLTTLLLNYVTTRFVAFMVFGPIKDPNGNNYPMSPKIGEQLRLPTFTGTRANFMIFFAIALAVFMWYFINKTELGFKMRAIGGNQAAAVFSGMHVKKVQCWAFLAGAAL